MRQSVIVALMLLSLTAQAQQKEPAVVVWFDGKAPISYSVPKNVEPVVEIALLLRLRANAIWPAMHEGTTAFFKTPGAKAMADSCGIVIGTSHCEPLLRNNVDEWDAKEQLRSGGGGVYYHLSYWGRPHDYLWLTTTQPGLIYNEMRQAYDHHVRQLWIANVHDPKVAGYDLELFLDMAWNIDCVNGETINDHYKAWLCRQFGKEAGRRLFPAMHEFYRLCGIRKPEFMGWTQVELDKKQFPRGLSQVSEVPLSPQEATTRLADFERIKATVMESSAYIRPALKDAFFAAIEYPVSATAAMNRKILCDSAESHRAYSEIQSLTKQYNEMRGGKWHGLMDAAPRRLPVFEDVHARLTGQAANIIMTLNACNYEKTSAGSHTIQMLGRSMNAVALQKVSTPSLSAPSTTT